MNRSLGWGALPKRMGRTVPGRTFLEPRLGPDRRIRAGGTLTAYWPAAHPALRPIRDGACLEHEPESRDARGNRAAGASPADPGGRARLVRVPGRCDCNAVHPR